MATTPNRSELDALKAVQDELTAQGIDKLRISTNKSYSQINLHMKDQPSDPESIAKISAVIRSSMSKHGLVSSHFYLDNDIHYKLRFSEAARQAFITEPVIAPAGAGVGKVAVANITSEAPGKTAAAAAPATVTAARPRIPMRPEGFTPPRPPRGYQNPTMLPDYVQGPQYRGLYGAHSANVPGLPDIRGSVPVYTYKKLGPNGALMAPETAGKVWDYGFVSWGEGVPGKALGAGTAMSPGSSINVKAQWATPLWETSFYSEAYAAYYNGKSLPKFMRARAGYPIELMRQGAVDAVLRRQTPGFGQVSLRLPVETDAGRMLFPSGRIAESANYIDFLGLFHRFDRRGGFDPVTGLVAGRSSVDALALTRGLMGKMGEANFAGQLATLGRYVGMDGKNVQLRGLRIFGAAGNQGFRASGGVGVVGGEYLSKMVASGALASPEALGRAMIGAAEDILFDYGRGVKVHPVSLEFAYSIGGLARQIGGSAEERMWQLADLDKLRVLTGGNFANVLSDPSKLAKGTQSKAIYDKFLGAWQTEHLTTLQSSWGEWTNNLFTLGKGSFYNKGGEMSPRAVMKQMIQSGWIKEQFGRQFDQLAAEQGLVKGTQAYAAHIGLLERLEAARLTRELTVGKSMATMLGASMMQREVVETIEQHDPLMGGFLRLARKVAMADRARLAAGETREQLVASYIESTIGGLNPVAAAAHDEVARRRRGMVYNSLYTPGVRGEFGKEGQLIRQGWIELDKTQLRNQLALFPGSEARVNWGYFDTLGDGSKRRIGMPLGRMFDVDVASRKLAKVDSPELLSSLYGLRVSGKPISIMRPDQDYYGTYAGWLREIRGKTGGRYAVHGEPGDPFSIRQIVMGAGEGRQGDSTFTAIRESLKGVEEILGHKVFSSSGTPGSGRPVGYWSLLAMDPIGMGDVAKNTWRHFQEAMWPIKPDFLARRSPRMSFLPDGKGFGKFSRGTVTLRLAEMAGGWTETDAAFISRWVHEKIAGAERSYLPIQGAGSFVSSPLLARAENEFGKAAGGHTELGHGIRSSNRAQLAMGWYIGEQQQGAFGKARAAAIAAAGDLSAGVKAAELEAKYGVRVTPWMREAMKRGLESSRSMVETGFLDQLVRSEGLGTGVMQSLAPNQRLFYAGREGESLALVTQSYHWTKMTTSFGAAKALVHGFVEGLRYGVRPGKDWEGVFRPLEGASPYQRRQASAALWKTRNLMEKMGAQGLLGAEEVLPKGWAMSYRLMEKEWAAAESWMTRGWRGKVFSKTSHYWDEALSRLEVKPGKDAYRVMGGFGRAYMGSYLIETGALIRAELGEASRMADAGAGARGMARLAIGLGASPADALSLAKGITDTVSTGVGKVSRVQLESLDLMMREKTAMLAVAGYGGDIGARSMRLDPYDPVQRLQANILSVYKLREILNQPELIDQATGKGIGQFEHSRLLRLATAWQAVHPLLEGEVHLKPAAASEALARQVEMIMTTLNDRGAGKTLRKNPALLAQVNKDLKAHGAEIRVGWDKGGSPYELTLNFLRSDAPGELAAHRLAHIEHALVTRGILPEKLTDPTRIIAGTSGIVPGRRGIPELGGLVPESSYAIGVREAAAYMTETVNSGIALKPFSEINPKDLMMHMRLTSAVAQRLAGGKLTQRQSVEFSRWFLQQHIQPSPRTNQFKIFMAGMTDMQMFDELLEARPGKGSRMAQMLHQMRDSRKGYAGQPSVSFQQVLEDLAPGLKAIGRGSVAEATSEEILLASQLTLGRKYPMGFRLNLWQHYGEAEVQGVTLGRAVIDQLESRLASRVKDPKILGDVMKDIRGYIENEDYGIKLFEKVDRPDLKRPGQVVGRYELKNLRQALAKHKMLAADASELFIAPFLGEDTIFNAFAQGTQARISGAATSWVELVAGLAQPGRSVLSDEPMIETAVRAIEGITTHKGEEFYFEQIGNVTRSLKDAARRELSSLTSRIGALGSETAEAAEAAVKEASGMIPSMRAYLAPLIQKDKLLTFMEEMKAKGVYDIRLALTAEETAVSGSAIRIGMDQAEKTLWVKMNQKDYQVMVEVARQPTIYPWSSTTAMAELDPRIANGVLGMDSSLITVHLMGDTDTDKAAMLLFGDRAQMLRQWVEENKIHGVQVADLTDKQVAGELALKVRKSAGLSQMISDDILKSIWDDGKGVFDLEQAATLTHTTMRALGFADKEMPDTALSVIKLANMAVTSYGSHIDATANAAKAEIQKNLTGLADALMMALPASVEHIQGHLFMGEELGAVPKGLELIAQHMGTKGLGVYQKLQQVTAGNFSQAFIGGKHGYTSFIENIVPAMGLVTADEETMGWLGEHPEVLERSVRGLMNPDEFVNFKEAMLGMAQQFQDRASVLQAAADRAGIGDHARGVLGKVSKILSGEEVEGLFEQGNLQGQKLAKTLRELHESLLERGEMTAVADLPWAHLKSYEKEGKLLEHIQIKEGKPSISGTWQQALRQIAAEEGSTVEEVTSRTFQQVGGLMQAIARNIEDGKRGFMFSAEEDGLLSGEAWFRKVLPKDLRRAVIKDEATAVKVGFSLLAPGMHSIATALRDTAPEFRSLYKGPAWMRLKNQAMGMVKDMTPGLEEELGEKEARKFRKEWANKYAALMGTEGLATSKTKFLPVAEDNVGAILGDTLGSPMMHTAAGPVGVEEYARQISSGAELTPATGLLDDLEAEGRTTAGTKGAAQAAPTTAGALTAEEAFKASLEKARAKAVRTGESVSSKLEQQTKGEVASALDSSFARSVAGLAHNPAYLGVGLTAGAIIGSKLLSTGAPAPDSSWSLPKMSKEVLDDYDSVVDEVAPNPSPVRVTPKRSSYGMQTSQKLRMTDVDNGALNTVARSLSGGDSTTKLTIRDQSRTQRRWMLRREVDEHLASKY